MLKRRSRWLAGAAGLFLVLSMSGVAMGVTPPDAVPDVDTTASFEDVDGNGIDDDCQDEVAAADPDAVTAEQATVDTNADGVISTTEAAHSNRTGGKNCNHGGYVSWIAHQNGCAAEPTEPVAETEAVACDEGADEADTDAEAAKKDKDAARAFRAALKAERALARDAAKAERALARETKRSERAAAHDTRKAERQAAKAAKQAERHAAKAARQNKGH